MITNYCQHSLINSFDADVD